MRHPLLRNSEGQKSYCRAGYAIVFVLLLFVLIVEAWKINMSKPRLADFSPEEIEELVGISNAMDNMISSRESPIGVKTSDQEKAVGAKKLAELGNIDPQACKYAGQDGSLTSQEIIIKDYKPTAVKPASIEQFPADFVEKQTVGDEWLKSFLDDVLHKALIQNGNLAGCIVSMGPMKEKDRVFEKAKNDYGGDIMKVMDLSRATVVCQNLVYMKTALQVMHDNLCNDGCPEGHANENAYLIRIKNKGFDLDNFPEGFTMTKMADITCNISPPNTPYAVEVQFAILPILLKKANLHAIYDNFRSLEEPTPTQCFDFMKESQDVMKSTWQKAVVDRATDMGELSKYLTNLANGNGQEKIIANLKRQFPSAARELIASILKEKKNDGEKVASELQKIQKIGRQELIIRNLESRFPPVKRGKIESLLIEKNNELPLVVEELRKSQPNF